MAVQLLAHEKVARDLRTSNRVSTKPHLSLAQLFNLYKRTSIECKSSEHSSITVQGVISEAVILR
jgi:hypothetical protein